MSYRWRIALSLGALAVFGCLPAVGLASSSGKGSETIRDVDCVMYDGYGALFHATGVLKVERDDVRATLTCRAREVPTPGVDTIYFDYATTGHGCGVATRVTYDWLEAVSTRGVATMTCRFGYQ